MSRAATVLAAAWMLSVSSALAASSYDRNVQIDWEPIPGAERYEVEWFTGADCATAGGTDTASGPLWQRKLPGGAYCVRVRGVGLGEAPGQWTDFQRLDVRPKPPARVDRAGDVFRWERVPYASGYDVQVTDGAGKVLLSKPSAETELRLDEAFFRVRKIERHHVQVMVRARVGGVEPSIFSPPATYPPPPPPPAPPEAAKALVAGKPPPPEPLVPGPEGAISRLGKLAPRGAHPPQPPAQAIEADEAVARFRISGERPVAPTLGEWAVARTPEQKDSLRRRSIASQRVQLLERVESSRPPQFALSVLTGAGPSLHSSSFDRDAGVVEPDERGFFPMTRVEAQLGRDRPWGLFIDATFVRSPRGSGAWFTGGTFGVERHVKLDASGDTMLRIGGGFGLLRAPLVDSSSADAVYGLHNGAIGLRMALDTRFSPSWSWSAFASYFHSLGTTELRRFFSDSSVSASRAEARTGPVVRLSPVWEVGGGLYLAHQNTAGRILGDGGGSSNEFGFQATSTGLYVQATYLTSPSSERDLAAETRAEENGSRLWKAALELPMDFRVGTVMNTEQTGEQLSPAGGFGKGFRLALQRRWSQRSSLWLGARMEGYQVSDGGVSGNEWGARLGAGEEWNLFDRRDTWIRTGALVFTRRDFATGRLELDETAPRAQAQILSYGLEPEISLERSWGETWSGAVSFSLGLPFGVDTDAALPSSGGDWTRAAQNYFWRASLGASYRLSEEWSGVLTYQYETVRYALEGKQGGPTSTTPTMVLDSSSHRVGVGVQLRW